MVDIAPIKNTNNSVNVNLPNSMNSVNVTPENNNIIVDINNNIPIGASWGYISGDLLNQTDLKDALSNKADLSSLTTIISNTSGTNSGNETTTTIGTLINAATAKTTPVDADMFGLMDSAASNIIKKLSWANLKATAKTYFDTIYTLANLGGISNITGLITQGSNITITGSGTSGSPYSISSTSGSGTQLGTCSTASATTQKDVTLSGFSLSTGATVLVSFTNANTCLPIAKRDLQVSFSSGNANDDFGLYTPTVIGSPTFTGNKFNSNGTTGITYPIRNLLSGAWCIQETFNISSFAGTSALMCSLDHANGVGVGLQITTGGKFLLYLSSNTNTWDIANGVGGSFTFSTNTPYYARLRFTGTQYLVDYSTNGTTWINDITITSSTIVQQLTANVAFGIWEYNNSAPLTGTIDDIYMTIGSSTIIPKTNSVSLNVNSTTAKLIASEDGTVVSALNPAYFPAGSTIEFTYNGTYWVFKRKVISSYVNGVFGYRQYSDGWVEQYGWHAYNSGSNYAVTFLKSFINTNYALVMNQSFDGNSIQNGSCAENRDGRTVSSFVMQSETVAGVSSSWYAWGY